MANVKRNQDMLSDEKRQETIDELINFFKNERDEDIGVIAAESLLNHFLQDVGMQLYNKGVEDSLAYLKERIESIEVDMESLIKR